MPLAATIMGLYNWQHNLLLRLCLSYGKGHKLEVQVTSLVIYGLGGGHSHTYQHESDLKLGARQPSSQDY